MRACLRHNLLCFLLIAALAAQCLPIAFAANPYPEIYHLEGGVPDENGAWTSEYWADERGNRLEEETAGRVRAAAELPRSYDLRDYDLVTRVKHQAGSSNCWAFGAIASLESSYIRQGYGTMTDTDFSEAHLVWFAMHQRTPDTTDPTYGDGLEVSKPFLTAGNWNLVSSTLMRGSGIQLEENAPWITTYDTDRLMEMEQPESERYVSYARMWNATSIRDNSATALKQKILQNGAATMSYYDDYSFENTGYTPDKSCYYQTAHTNTNHIVAVVGWDDDYPRTNFNENQRPSADGAWLIKGSWSTGWAASGYYWISYADPSVCEFVSYTAAPADIYDHIYQYDGSFPTVTLGVSNSAWMANVFTAERDELLTHVGFFSPNAQPIKVTAEVYVAPEDFRYSGKHPTDGMQKIDAATTTVSGVEYGYSTIELTTPTELTAGRMFSVVLTMELSGSKVLIPVEGYAVDNPNEGVKTFSGDVGTSFFGYSSYCYDTNAYPYGSQTIDYNNVPLKAMTRELSAQPTLTLENAPDKTTYWTGETLDTTGLSLVYTDGNGESQTVTEGFVCDVETFETAGEQAVTVTYSGLTVTFGVTVRQTGLFLVSDATARAGETVDVAVRICDNPGIVSAWLELNYDPDVLTLEGVRNGEIFADGDFTPGNDMTATPFRVLFLDALSAENYTQDGDLVVFTFRVRTDAPSGETAIALDYDTRSTFDADLQSIPFSTQDGMFTVQRLSGDVNADGVIDLKDAVMLRRYLADWNVTINLSNADVDLQDGATLKDVTYICRYLAGGYNVTLL